VNRQPISATRSASVPAGWASRLPKALSRLSVVSLLLYCVFGALLVVIGAMRLIPATTVDTVGSEMVNPFLGILAVRTGHLYHSLSAPPYTPQPFGPLSYVASATIARASHLDLDATIRLGRILDFVCFLLCAVMAWLINRRLGFSQGESALAGLMLLAQPAFQRWGAAMRPDIPALLAMLAALYFAVRNGKNRNADCALAGLLVAVGFLFKQSAAVAGVAIAVVYLFRREYRRLAILIVSAGVAVLIALALLLRSREPFLEHFFVAGQESWSLFGGAEWVANHMSKPTIFLALAVGAVGSTRALFEDEPAQMVASFALFNLCAGFATIPQLGGAMNYFLPGFAGCALLLPFAIRVFRENSNSVHSAGILIILAFLVGLAECAVAYYRSVPAIPRQGVPWGYVASLRILSDDDYLVQRGRDPELVDLFTTHSLELQHRWDSSGLIQNVQSGDYDLVVLNHGHIVDSYRGIALLGAKVTDALNANYTLVCVAGNTLVLKPRSREVNADPEMLDRLFGTCRPEPSEPNLSIGYFAH
jgi:Dolichyl-phosphate-mannose-protein mannosyltransferase